jgi:hypothetical protein
MSSNNNGIISSKKVSSSVAGYIWDSPCLKPLIFNPFVLGALILIIIWTLDLLYGKTFAKCSTGIMVQHMLTAYVVVSVGVGLNNMLIKHRYRLDKYEARAKAKSVQVESTEATLNQTDLISPYTESRESTESDAVVYI